MFESPVIIGEITGVYGVKGWVKVFSHTEPRLNIVKYNPWLIKQGKDWKSVKLLSGRSQGKTIVAQIEGVNDRDQAHAMIGTEIGIERSQLKTLGKDDFYWRDLEGLKVVDVDGKALGQVSHLIETGANDVMVVKLPPEQAQDKKIKETMIPYIFGDVVKRVDLQGRLIEVDWDDDYI
ncbi:ribosome maturation factor RimM [Aliikangiella coralliicola]|uniref:Ribosome maturation factor RimM n=1 Tax=Aliikangiella coralliicola TaxID=2592383 RepID=A0A545UAS6_9GAMM|nr:ribosome maturation factor RimM [Aliikangiella coralliicola]TQV86572.1 ribosome maturation factor RimM [Aliikangiella coralliicola]